MPLSFKAPKDSRRSRASFTLIELLIVIAVIAVLATVVILSLNPAELLRQARDANRLSDMKTLDQAITLYSEDTGGSLGTANTTYVSVPDPAATSSQGTDCSSLGLPALPAGDVYHCVGPASSTRTDGTGWLPIDFQSASFGSPIGTLPEDPVNSTSTGLYYTYTYGGGNNYEFTAPCEATKNQKGGACDKDSGVSSLTDEVGTDLALAPAAVIGRASTYAELTSDESALVGYWKFDEGSGTTANDSSGNGNNGSINNSPLWESGSSCLGGIGNCLEFSDGYKQVVVPDNQSLDIANNLTVLMWIDVTVENPTGGAPHPIAKWSTVNDANYVLYYCAAACSPANAYAWYGNVGGVWGGLVGSTGPSIPLNTWEQVASVYENSFGGQMYWNGSTYGGLGRGGVLATNADNLVIGNDCASGCGDTYVIQDVRIYNRALSPAEIAAIYNAEK